MRYAAARFAATAESPGASRYAPSSRPSALLTSPSRAARMRSASDRSGFSADRGPGGFPDRFARSWRAAMAAMERKSGSSGTSGGSQNGGAAVHEWGAYEIDHRATNGRYEASTAERSSPRSPIQAAIQQPTSPSAARRLARIRCALLGPVRRRPAGLTVTSGPAINFNSGFALRLSDPQYIDPSRRGRQFQQSRSSQARISASW